MFASSSLQVGDKVIIGTHNTGVLSTTAVNDLVMILYYDPSYTQRSSSSNGFHQKC